MRSKTKEISSEKLKGKAKTSNAYCLVLFNDDVNKYEFVVESLIDICRHDPIQAEQCTFIAHHKGKCDIKNGSFEELETMKLEFDRRKINTLIYQN